MTADILAWLLAQLGAGADQTDLAARYAQLGNARAVAIEVLRLRLAALLANPLKVTLTGVVSIDNSLNVTALQAQIQALESGEPPAPDDPHNDPEFGLGFAVISTVPIRRTR